MINRNYENMLATLLVTSSAGNCGNLQILDVYGRPFFANNNIRFPSHGYQCLEQSFTTDPYRPGISLGTGSTPATKLDTNLENTITNNINVVITSIVEGCKFGVGEPYLEYTITVTNTGDSEFVIREIGYKQPLSCNEWANGTGETSVTCLIDRTVLSSPITIQAGDAGVIKYTLKVVPVPKTVRGVKIVSFAYGTDEEIAAMIDAARAGTIDLQTDGEWAVGDCRTIHLSSFYGGGNKFHEEEDIDICISEFGDYMSCGCLFQFDFRQALGVFQRMNGYEFNVYGESEMFTTTLPALVAALPSWLKNRLKPFSVYVGIGGGESTLVTVTNNKLALRSEIEVYGKTVYSREGEGQQVKLYKTGVMIGKRLARTGGYVDYWLRSPALNNQNAYCRNFYYNNTCGTTTATGELAVAPFGCI